MTKKQIARCIVFLLIVVALLAALSDLYENGNNSNYDRRISTYFDLEKNTIDAVYIGTSAVDRYWVSAKAYEDYGMTVYPLSSDAMPVWFFEDMMELSCKGQNPGLFIIDARAFGQTHSVDTANVRAWRVLSALDFFSIDRIKMAFKTMNVIYEIDESEGRFDISYLLPFVKFHSKWAESGYLFSRNIGNVEHAYGGFYWNANNSIRYSEKLKAVEYDPYTVTDLDPMSEEILYELFDYIRENELTVLFVDSPQMMDDVEIGHSNRIRQIVEEEGFDYISFNNPETCEKYGLELDVTADYYNPGHTNYYGAIKYTDAFAAYLDENYELSDRRGDEAAKKYWDGIYTKLAAIVARQEEKQSK